MRANRKGIPEGMKKNLKKGEFYGDQRGVLKIIKRVDRRTVLMLTTDPAHDCSLVETGKKNKKCEEIKKPQCILE